jgi:hypothetical protein
MSKVIYANTFRQMTVQEILQSVDIAISVLLRDKLNELTKDDIMYIATIIEELSKVIYRRLKKVEVEV